MVFQLLKNLDFHPRMGLVSRTIRIAAFDLFFFFILMGLITGLYAILGTLIFGRESNNFATVSHSTVTMLSALAGLYSHPSDDDSVSQLFYWSYMLVSFFVMLNALLAIIIDAYTAVVAEIGSAPPDPLIFAFWSRVDGNGTAAGDHAVPLDDVMPLLEAWVGPELARVEATSGAGLFARPRGSLRTEDEFTTREEHKRTLHADRARGDAFRAMYAKLAGTAPSVEVRPTELSLTWKPDPMSPAICIDFHLLCLVIAVYEAYHEWRPKSAGDTRRLSMVQHCRTCSYSSPAYFAGLLLRQPISDHRVLGAARGAGLVAARARPGSSERPWPSSRATTRTRWT